MERAVVASHEKVSVRVDAFGQALNAADVDALTAALSRSVQKTDR